MTATMTDKPQPKIMPQGILWPAFTLLPLARLHPSSYNPRTIFTEESLEELANSIRNVGVLEPILVRPEFDVDNEATGEYEIVAGERRYRASLLAELKAVPCIVRRLSDKEAIEIAVTENLQRSDLTAFEEARGFKLLLDSGHTQAQIAERLGCSQTRISRTLGLLELPEHTRKLIEQGELSHSHGQRLLPWAAFPAVCNALADIAIRQEWKKVVLDEGLKNGAFSHQFSRLGEGKAPIIRHVGWTTKFDWKAVCLDCPFKAFRRPTDTSDYGYCMRPEHYDQLQAEAQREHEVRQEEMKRQALADQTRRAEVQQQQHQQEQQQRLIQLQIEHKQAEAVAETTNDKTALIAVLINTLAIIADSKQQLEAPATPKLPYYKELTNVESLEYEIKSNTLPVGCSEACECRGNAISFRYRQGEREEEIIPVCLNKARFSQLRVEEKHRSELEGRMLTNKIFAPIEEALVNESPVLHHRILVFVAGEYIRHLSSYGQKQANLAEIVKRHKIKLDLKAIDDYDTKTHIQAYNSLAKLGQAELLHFLADIIIAYETSRLLDRATNSKGKKPGELVLESHVAEFFLRACPKTAPADDRQLALPGTVASSESEGSE